MDSAVKPPTTQEALSFYSALGEVRQFALSLLKNFLRFVLFGGGFCLVLATVIYISLRDGPMWKTVVGSGIMLTISLVVTVALGIKLSILLAVVDTVKAKALGEKVMQALFSSVLGVTNETPQGEVEMTRSVHGMPVAELKERMHTAGRSLLEHRVTTLAVPRFARWLADKAQQVVVWAAIRVIVANCTKTQTPQGNVDLLALRSSLAGYADKLLIAQITGAAYRFVLIVALGMTGAGWLLVKVFG